MGQAIKTETITLTNGNQKYHKTGKKRKLRTVIFNICSAHDCPSAKLGLCQLKRKKNGDLPCYAHRDETMYKQCLPFRRQQEKQWDKYTAEGISHSINTIQKSARQKVTHFRLDESGDFRNLADVLKAATISAEIKRESDIETFTYSARKDLLTPTVMEVIDKAPIVINGSGFMVHNEYRVVPEDYTPKNKREIWCRNNCHICRACKGKNGLVILAKQRSA